MFSTRIFDTISSFRMSKKKKISTWFLSCSNVDDTSSVVKIGDKNCFGPAGDVVVQVRRVISI